MDCGLVFPSLEFLTFEKIQSDFNIFEGENTVLPLAFQIIAEHRSFSHRPRRQISYIFLPCQRRSIRTKMVFRQFFLFFILEKKRVAGK